ncbi:MAG: hypothetical protein ACJA1N_002653, partial [Saprospiraceae bacterium]
FSYLNTFQAFQNRKAIRRIIFDFLFIISFYLFVEFQQIDRLKEFL